MHLRRAAIGNKVASVRTCLSQSPRPPFQGGDQGLRAFHPSWLSLLANSGPASDALFGTRGESPAKQEGLVLTEASCCCA